MPDFMMATFDIVCELPEVSYQSVVVRCFHKKRLTERLHSQPVIHLFVGKVTLNSLVHSLVVVQWSLLSIGVTIIPM